MSGSAMARHQPPSQQEMVTAATKYDLEDFEPRDIRALEDLLESGDPRVTAWQLELAGAAILRFSEAGPGPEEHALTWLRYAQRATTVLAGPLSEQAWAASTATARLCLRLGRIREAAAAWEVAVIGADQRRQLVQADNARLHWAWCLHRLGCCDDAVTVLRQVRGGPEADGGAAVVVAQILCLRMLVWCGRQEDAAALWSAIESHTTPAVRRSAMHELRKPANSSLNGLAARTHVPVCTYRSARSPGGKINGYR